MADHEEELKSLLMRVKEESEKQWNLRVKSWNSTFKKKKQKTEFLVSKIITVTAAMKLKDACFLERKLNKPR